MANIPTYIFMFFFYLLVLVLSYLLVRAPFAQTPRSKEVDRGRPSGHSRRGLGAIRAVCRAWRALKVFLLGRGCGYNKEDDLPGVLLEASFCTRYPPFFEINVLGVFAGEHADWNTRRDATLLPPPVS